MHFYTYDEWAAYDYYSTDTSTIYRGHTAIFDASEDSSKTYLTVRSCWKDPKFNSTYPGVPVIQPELEPIDLDIGCLYAIKEDGANHRATKGCIQYIPEYTLTHADAWPYLHLSYRPYYNKIEGVHKKVLSINIHDYAAFDKILIFQSIYSGAISFQEARSSLEFYFSNKWERTVGYDYNQYDYRINTCINSDASIMVVGAMITFDYVGSRKYIIIDSICEPVYGHVDMSAKYNWDLLWKTFTPSKDSKILESSIMHRSKD